MSLLQGKVIGLWREVRGAILIIVVRKLLMRAEEM